MPKQSAGLLIYRRHGATIEVFLVHPGGPFWAKKDLGVWSIPKGEYEASEKPLDAAIREFHEETGFTASPPFVALGTIKQSGGKVVSAWACAGEYVPSRIRSNTFTMEWPPRSGQQREFPEVDRAAWFDMDQAREKILPVQRQFLDALVNATGDY